MKFEVSCFTYLCVLLQIFRKEPFFYGHDNYDQLVKIARVSVACEVVASAPDCWVMCVWEIFQFCFYSWFDYLYLNNSTLGTWLCCKCTLLLYLVSFLHCWLFLFNDFCVIEFAQLVVLWKKNAFCKEIKYFCWLLRTHALFFCWVLERCCICPVSNLLRYFSCYLSWETTRLSYFYLFAWFSPLLWKQQSELSWLRTPKMFA